MRQSSQTVTYKSLQAFVEEILKDSEAKYRSGQTYGTSNLEPLRSKIVHASVLVRMLKKCEPGKQADMYELFKQVVK